MQATRMLKKVFVAAMAIPFLWTTALRGQTSPPQQSPKEQTTQNLTPPIDGDGEVNADSTGGNPKPPTGVTGASTAQQPKRILGIIPNYRSVTADVQLPPLSARGKFKLAAQDTVDYGSFLFVGFLSGVALDRHAVPEFGQGAAGYARYYWHFMADQTAGNYLTEAIVPSLTHEDPRYYTRGNGGLIRRTGYAVSRLVITKSDSNHGTFNFSEILGNGLGAAVSNFYYPESERTWIKTRQKWTTQIAFDGAFNILKEFWPDISAHLARQH